MNVTSEVSMVTPTTTPYTNLPVPISTVTLIMCGALVVMALTSLIGNLAVLGTLHHAWSTVGAKPGNFLALVLAGTDLLNTTINVPIVLTAIFYGAWDHSYPIRVVYFFSLLLLSGASNMILCVISINRYAVVARPNTSENVGRLRARKLALFAWCHSLATAIISVITWIVIDTTIGRRSSNPLQSAVPPLASQIVGYTLVVFAPMVIMTVTYMRLFRKVKMRLRAVGARKCTSIETVSEMASRSVVQDGPSVFGAVKKHNKIMARPTKSPNRHADFRTAVTLLILLGVFVVCWTPVAVFTLLTASGGLPHQSSAVTYLTLSTVLVFIIPACNPFVYSMRNAHFRAATKDFLNGLWKGMTSPCCGGRRPNVTVSTRGGLGSPVG